MKFLDLPQISSFNSLLGNLQSPDGIRLQSRIEVYTCKAAGNDKKLLKQLGLKYSASPSANNGESSASEMESEANTPVKKLQNNESSNLSRSPSLAVIDSGSGMNVKMFYYLISTMNNMFPDYDFSEIPSEVFVKQKHLSTLINQVNTSIFNTGINRNTGSFSEFSRRMWDCIDSAIGGLQDCEIYSFCPETGELEDPFRDQRGTVWSLNAFFYNRKLKRVLVFHVRAINELNTSLEDLTGLRSGALTPISSV